MVDDAGTTTGTEDLAQLQEQLDAARADVERLERDAANAGARAQQESDVAEQLRTELRVLQDEAAIAVVDMDRLRGQSADAAEREQQATARYRDLVVRSEPALPPELIAGDTIEAIDASVEEARTLTGRVRTHIEAQSQAARVPAGAPPRAAPDLASLTPDQKIRYGLNQRSS